jgi:hypothetical protein
MLPSLLFMRFMMIRSDTMERVPVQRLDYSSAFSACLDPGEKVLWAGQPRQGIFLRASDALAIPFSLLWGGFAIFWETTVLKSMDHRRNMPPFIEILFPLWGIPFVVIGLYIIFGRFFVDAWRRRQTWYGVTDRRALVLRTGSRRTTTSFELRSISEVKLQEHADGTGTLTFGPIVSISQNRGFSFWGAPTNVFDHTPDAANAYRIVRRVQQSLTISQV